MDLAQRYKIRVPEALGLNEPILVVEQKQDMRMILVHHLQKVGFNDVRPARDGMQAIDILKTTKNIAAIICNLDMTEINGLEVLSEAKENSDINRPPFCLTMDNVSKEKLMLAVESGVDEILVKPFTLTDVVPKIKKAFSTFHNPKNPEKIYELAKEMLRKDELKLAIEIYQALAESAPKSARPLCGLAKIAVKQGKLDQVFEFLTKAEASNPQYVHIYSLRGNAFGLKKDYEHAIEAYRKAIELSPLNPLRYKDSGEILLAVQKYKEASELLEIAVKNNVEFADLYNLLSQACYYQKDYKAAAKYVRKAVEKEPDNTIYLNQLALSLKEIGEIEEAKKAYNRVIKLDPENKQALFNKAIMLSQTDGRDEAIKILKRLVAKDPSFEKAAEKLAQMEKGG